MQATAVCSTGFILPFKGTDGSLLPRTSFTQRRALIPLRCSIRTPPETAMVDYSSSASVFPAEACETIGGEACSVEMFPEAKPATTASIDRGRVGSEQVDREYFEYNEPKTVFPGEACDDLGGEFCEPEYQKGVHKETILSE